MNDCYLSYWRNPDFAWEVALYEVQYNLAQVLDPDTLLDVLLYEARAVLDYILSNLDVGPASDSLCAFVQARTGR